MTPTEGARPETALTDPPSTRLPFWKRGAAASVSADRSASFEGAYEPVSFGEFWGVLSLGLFVGSLSTRFLIQLLPFQLQGWHRLPPYAVSAVPVLAALGLVAAWIGGRKESAMCRFGFILNGIVLAISLLLVGLVVVWRLSR